MSLEGFGDTSSDSSYGPEVSSLFSFEGPEKNLEIYFVPHVGRKNGCRALSRAQLDAVLDEAKCLILSCITNEHLDAYVLSESSLFVYEHKIIIKTCGTTTLLKCIPKLLEYTDALSLKVEWVCYSRKNYSFPGEQEFPHCSFSNEVKFLNTMFSGHGYILGPVTDDHWVVYVSDMCKRPSSESMDRTLHIMMLDLDHSAAAHFFKSDDNNSDDMTKLSGIDQLVPGAKIDGCAFDPCGYSMNGILGDAYHTIHITPESHCSYASFETNASLESYGELIRHVLNVFRPRRFTMTFYADQASLDSLKENPCNDLLIDLFKNGLYKRKDHSCTFFEHDYCCFMGNWHLKESS